MKQLKEAVLILIIFASAAAKADRPEKIEFVLSSDDTVVFLGGTNMVRLQRSGTLETLLTHAFTAESKGPRFRDLSWEADTAGRLGTVVERWRPDGFGGRGDQFKRVGATVAFVQFGLLESMHGDDGLDRFREDYSNLLDELRQQEIRLVLLTSTPFETPESPHIPDLKRHNESLRKYDSVIAELGEKYDAIVVNLNLQYPFALTNNGMHVLPENQETVARAIVRQLGLNIPPIRKLSDLHMAVKEKHRLWYDYWRPANWKLLYGDDSRRGFTRGGEDYIPFREEWSRLIPLVERAERRVWAVASGELDPGHRRPEPEKLFAHPSANIKEELAAFNLADGFSVNLFASDQHGLTSPLSMRWDTSGRMYVTVTTTYPHVFPGDVPNDKIIVIEDVDKDGVADRSTVFADGLNIPTGLELGDGGVYVGQNTEILFLKDTDGDLIADEREVVLGGFGNGDSHQTINSFIWSPGGELYFGQGDGCESRVETPWGSSDLFQAGFYRFRPRRLKLDPLLDDFMGPGNPWGVAFDNWGQIFSVDGAGGVTFLSPGQIPSHHRIRLRRIGDPGGYCGVGHVDGEHLPESFRDCFVTCDFKRNRVIQFTVDRRGSGFDLDFEESLVESSHRNFRPVDVRQGPDGAIYVVDWYNPITCHQDDAYRHPDRDKAHGRIWRIAPDRLLSYPQDLATIDTVELIQNLDSDNPWIRYQVKRECTARKPEVVVSALETLLEAADKKSQGYEHLLFEVLSVYETLEVINEPLLLRCLNSGDERLRAYATRVVGRWHDRIGDPLSLLSNRVIDSDSLVRMEAVAACAGIPYPESITVAARAFDLEVDYDIGYVLKQATHHLQQHWLPAFREGRLRFQTPQHLASILNEAGGREVVDQLKELVLDGTLKNDSRRSAIESIIGMANEEDLTRFALNMEMFTDSEKYDAASHASALRQAVVVAKEVKASGDVSAMLRTLIRTGSDDVSVEAIRLAGKWNTVDLTGEIEELAADQSTATAVRAAALYALAEIKGDEAGSFIRTVFVEAKATGVQASAIGALSRVDRDSAVDQFARFITDDSITSKEVSLALAEILERDGGSQQLADVLTESELKEDVARKLLSAIFQSGRSDQAVLAVITNVLSVGKSVPEYDEQFVSELVDSAASNGNAQAGKVVFKTIGCISCHKVAGSGGTVGPDLTAVGTTLSGHRISEELLWPQKQVKEGFSLVRVITTEGRVLQGYERKTRETQQTGALLIEDPQSGELTKIDKDEIDVRQNAGSAMPSGLTTLLSQEQLLDLIAYLQNLGKL